MLSKINGLMTKAQERILRKAAKILCYSDKHDAYFFVCLKQSTGTFESNVVRIGSEYAVVHCFEPAQTQLAEVREVVR